MALAVVLLTYGLIAIVGGVFGYVAGKSISSLLVGSISGSLLIVSGVLIMRGLPAAAWIGFTATIVLIVAFARRYARTQAMIPSGLMLGVSVVVLGVLFTQLFQ